MHDRFTGFRYNESTNTCRKPEAHRNNQHVQNQKHSIACYTNIINSMLKVLDILAQKEIYSLHIQKRTWGKTKKTL